MDFWKMNGAGNDFIVIDNRPLHYSQQQLADLARTVCHRHLSIGPDGRGHAPGRRRLPDAVF